MSDLETQVWAATFAAAYLEGRRTNPQWTAEQSGSDAAGWADAAVFALQQYGEAVEADRGADAD